MDRIFVNAGISYYLTILSFGPNRLEGRVINILDMVANCC